MRTTQNRALVLHNFQGIWYEACTIRDLVSVSTDVYERPEWLLRYVQELGEYLLNLLDRVLDAGIKVILLDESWVGVGLRQSIRRIYSPVRHPPRPTGAFAGSHRRLSQLRTRSLGP